MKKRVVLVLLLLAVVTVMAFAATRVKFTTNINLGPTGEPIIRINWVEQSWTNNITINYTVMADIDSMTIKFKAQSPSLFSQTNVYSNRESWISKGKTYTADFACSLKDVSSVDIWLENVKMK